MQNFQSKKFVVLGAARQGLAVSRYLAKHGAEVILTDVRGKEQLTNEIESLEGYEIRLSLGGHAPELLDGASAICVSGGVPLNIPFLQEARSKGIPLTNDSQIFLEACPATVIGITGSAGKTTTTALVGLMAEKFFQMKQTDYRAWMGGNIGNPLIEKVDEITDDDLVVLELSSFQLEIMTHSPQIAAVLNLTPNHLDRHGTMQAYTEAKSKILRFQSKSDVAILNREDEGSWSLIKDLNADLISFGFNRPESRMNGTYVEKDWIWLQIGHDHLKMLPLKWIQLRGKHNISNVLAACAIAAGASIALPGIQTAVEEFSGVSHRLELVRTFKGAEWYDDSIATAPERTIAAIDSFTEPIVLLLGGRDKDLPWDKLAELVRKKVSRVILFGEAANLIAKAIGPRKPGQNLNSVVQCTDLHEAVKVAANQVEPGNVVLLSPGGTSFDEFKDFAERGEFFQKWVNELT